MASTMQRGGKNGGLKNEEIFVQLFNQSQDSWAASIFSKKCVCMYDKFRIYKGIIVTYIITNRTEPKSFITQL